MMMGLLVRNYIYLVGQVLPLPDDDGVVGEELDDILRYLIVLVHHALYANLKKKVIVYS